MTKQEIKKAIATYEESLKYWQKQKRIADYEVKHCKEYIRKYKEMLKRS